MPAPFVAVKHEVDHDYQGEPDTTAKDYRGRYYYDKFKIIPDARDNNTVKFLEELCMHYLEGLMWCIAYYIKGCISWTWYYPYNYGPMLIDMVQCSAKRDKIKFELRAALHPFPTVARMLTSCLFSSAAQAIPVPHAEWGLSGYSFLSLCNST